METNIQQTGNDVLAYHGDPDLAYGSGAANADLQPGVDPLASFNAQMAPLYQHDYEMNMANYHQKIRDRDEVNKMLAEGTDLTGNIPGASAKDANGNPIQFSLLDPDKQALAQKADEIRKMVVSNPHMQNDRSAFGAYTQKLNEFKQMKFDATARAVEASKQRNDIASEPDADQRTARQQHLTQELSKGTGHIPYPFMQPLTFDEKVVSPDVKTETSGTPKYYQDAQGIWHEKDNESTPIDEFNNSGKYVPGSAYFTQANNKYKRAISAPGFLNPDFVNNANARIADVNKKEGLSANDPNYVQPIATIGDDGKVVPNKNVSAFVRSLHIAQKYRNDETDKISKDAQQAQKVYAEQQKTQVGTDLEKAKLQQEVPAHVEQMKQLGEMYKAQAALARRKGQFDNSTGALKKQAAVAPVKEAFDIYDQTDKVSNFTPATDLLTKFTPNTPEGRMLSKIVTDVPDAQVSPVNTGSQSVMNILAKPTIDKMSGKITGVVKPKFTYMVKPQGGDPDETRLVGVYPDGQILSVTRKEAVDRLIDYKAKYAGGGKMVDLKNASHAVMDDYNNLSATQASAPVTSTAPIRKKVGGITYEKGSDNQWYKIE